MSEVDTYIKENAEVHQFASEISNFLVSPEKIKELAGETSKVLANAAQIYAFASEIARMLSYSGQPPEFSNENMSVSDASKLIGIPPSSIRAGIVYGWLPIGTAIQNNKPAKNLSGGRITYIISPRKVYEVTGHIWKGKEALNK